MPICLEIGLLLKKGKSNVKFDVRLIVYNGFVFMKKVNQKVTRTLKGSQKKKTGGETLFCEIGVKNIFKFHALSSSKNRSKYINIWKKKLHFRTSFSGLSDLFISLWILLYMITYLYHCCWGFLITNDQDLVMF